VFTQWKAPPNFRIEVFVVRVGEWGGHMLVDCDDPLAVHKVARLFLHLNFRRVRWLPLRRRFGSNSKPSPGAMVCNASDIRISPGPRANLVVNRTRRFMPPTWLASTRRAGYLVR